MWSSVFSAYFVCKIALNLMLISDINPKRYNGEDTNKNLTKTTSIRCKVRKMKVVSTISASMYELVWALNWYNFNYPFLDSEFWSLLFEFGRFYFSIRVHCSELNLDSRLASRLWSSHARLSICSHLGYFLN